jgi:two-component system, cell cycle response regulator
MNPPSDPTPPGTGARLVTAEEPAAGAVLDLARPPVPSAPVLIQARPAGSRDLDEKTRVTMVVAAPPEVRLTGNDCLVIVYTKEPVLLGKRFLLEQSPFHIGRGSNAHIVLDADSVSRRHAHLDRRSGAWVLVDDGSTNGTYCNDEHISREVVLKSGDRIKVGHTIFKFLSGADVEAQYHEEIYRMTILDGLTQIYNKRYLVEALEREVIRARRHDRGLALVMFDIDHFKLVNDTHGHLAGDFVLRELARVMQARVRRDEVLARYGGEELAVILPEALLSDAVALAEALRVSVREHVFRFQTDDIRVTISAGAAVFVDSDQKADDLVRRADERLYEAKNGGRDRVCS